MDLERAMEFLLEQRGAFQARAEEQQARFDAQMTTVSTKLDQVADQQTKTEAALRRAIRLSVLEQRRERVRRREADLKLAEADSKLAEADATLNQRMAELSAESALTQRSLRAFMDSLKQPHNGHDTV
jgi:hypothetical protein